MCSACTIRMFDSWVIMVWFFGRVCLALSVISCSVELIYLFLFLFVRIVSMLGSSAMSVGLGVLNDVFL